MKYAITIVSGLAIAAGAEANLTFVQQGGPAMVAGGATLTLFNGQATGSLGIFTFTFGYDEPVADSSWASDMAIEIFDPNGNTLRIGGYDTPGLYTPIYDGAASDSPGIYADSIDLAAAGLSGTGIWTVTITNDWGGDPNPNEIGGAAGNLVGDNPFTGTLGGLTVPAPGAIVLLGVAGLAGCRRRRIASLA